MMQKRKLSSLLLISFIVVFGFSFAAANTVDFGTSNQLRCDGALQNISIEAAQDIVGFEIIAEVSGDYTALPTVSFNAAVPGSWSTYIAYRGDGVSPDTIRLAAIRINAGDPVLAAGAHDVATLTISTADACDGSITITGGDWTDNVNPTGTITTQFIDASTTIYAAAITNGTITIVNDAPALAAIADGAITWNAPGNVFAASAVATDGDVANGCEELVYSLVTAPAAMTIDAATGEIDWTANGADVCQHLVTVQVADKCGATAQTDFTICVSNEGPTMDDLAQVIGSPGETMGSQFVGVDPDGGPNGLLYEVVSFSGDGLGGVLLLDPATGEFTFDLPVDMTGDANFSYELCVSVSDQTPLCVCNENNADTACVELVVIPLRYVIEKSHNVLQGQFTTISLGMPDTGPINYEIGGFEFLIQYDASALSFMGADPGAFVTDCGWEYFTYRVGPFGNCGSACPSGMVKIVGLAETNNGPNHPTCFNNEDGANEIASLKFYVSNDRNLECQYVPIRFTWIDCSDNSVSDVEGAHLFWGRRVFDYDGPVDGGTTFGMEHYTERVAPAGDVFPTIYGPTDECDAIDDAKADIFSYIDFFNGGIDIVCADSIDARGDINLDGIAYTVADAVMFTNYFIEGLGALYYSENVLNGVIVGYAGSVAASDVNADGLTLTVADLVFMIRVIVGDEMPTPKEVVSVNAVVNYTNQGTLSVNDAQMGAAFVVFEGNVSATLLADNMEMKSAFDGENTRVLVYSMDANSFSGEFLSANADVVSIELATSASAAVVPTLIPSEFGLDQNYPNPFNPTTNIEFNLPSAGDYSLTIYNVTGQVVAEFTGAGEAGVEMIQWDATSNASGVYFYKLTLDGFSATKKMVLLK